MNLIEGFFGIGAIIGPAIVAYLLADRRQLEVGLSGRRGHAVRRADRGGAALAQFHAADRGQATHPTQPTPCVMIGDPTALFFGTALDALRGCRSGDLRVGPDLSGRRITRAREAWFAAYAVSIFFVLRAAGQFLGVWLLTRWRWHAAVAVLQRRHSGVFRAERGRGRGMGGVSAARFRSLHGRDLSDAQFERHQLRAENEHGAAAGVILFFTCLSAVTAPLAMGALSDVTGQIAYGFWLATGLAALLFAGLLLNWLANPTRQCPRSSRRG